MTRPPLDDLAAFAAVARARSFTRAAAERRVSTSALSHTVTALEARLGTRLLNRTSRAVTPTDAGARLLETLTPALTDIDTALDHLAQSSGHVTGSVRLTATHHAYNSVLRPILPAFLARHPAASVEIILDYGHRDIVADNIDAGIRIGEKLQPGMIATRVGPDLRMAVVAAPAYLAAHGTPDTPRALAAHRCINQRFVTSGDIYPWEFDRDGQSFAIKLDGPLTFNDHTLILDAALSGLGVAYLLADLAAPHLQAGRLFHLFEDWTPPFPGYFLYHPSRRHRPATLAALIAALKQPPPVPRDH